MWLDAGMLDETVVMSNEISTIENDADWVGSEIVVSNFPGVLVKFMLEFRIESLEPILETGICDAIGVLDVLRYWSIGVFEAAGSEEEELFENFRAFVVESFKERELIVEYSWVLLTPNDACSVVALFVTLYPLGVLWKTDEDFDNSLLPKSVMTADDRLVVDGIGETVKSGEE